MWAEEPQGLLSHKDLFKLQSSLACYVDSSNAWNHTGNKLYVYCQLFLSFNSAVILYSADKWGKMENIKWREKLSGSHKQYFFLFFNKWLNFIRRWPENDSLVTESDMELIKIINREKIFLKCEIKNKYQCNRVCGLTYCAVTAVE